MYKWEIESKAETGNLGADKILKIILKNRGIVKQRDINEFLNPKIETINANSLGIDKAQTKKTISRIKKAIKNKEKIIVFGDYDVDGITGSAVLWEGLKSLGADVMPYIPNRIEEGYGLSIKGIVNLKKQYEDTKLIITVDNGIVANDAVDFAKEQGIDVIITDHHVPSVKLPNAFSIFHTTKICGAAVAWVLMQEMGSKINHLELVALATVADLMPLTNENRALVKFGLQELRKTKRVGLLELFKEAAIDKNKIGVYEIGHIIAPRLNAMGRLEDAMDSLRLLCTPNPTRALELANKLGLTNRQRQQITTDLVLHAKNAVLEVKVTKKLIFISHESYQPGIIGLIAGRLVEEFYRPAIVVSKGEIQSKGSARSISGFNIIEFLRQAEEFMVDAGGHPMAAGFTTETVNLEALQEKLEKLAEEVLTEDHFVRVLKIDMEIPFSVIDQNLYNSIQNLSPFGMGNPEPTFLSSGATVENLRIVGKDKKHLKLLLTDGKSKLEAIAFNGVEKAADLKIGDKIDIAYTVDENIWNGNKTLQLKIKNVRL